MKKRKIKKSKKTNICFHISNISNCGGTEKVTIQIANLLLKYYDNYNVYILSNYYDQNLGSFFACDKRIKFHSLYDKNTHIRFKPHKTITKINSFISKEKIDILIGVDTILAVFDIPAIKETHCKYIAWEHFNFYCNLGVKLRDKGRKLASLKADAVVVLSKKDYKYFNDNLKVKTNLVQIYNPFNYVENDTIEYNCNTNIILSSGRLTYQKGFDLLIEVANLLKQKGANFEWIILGEGEDRKQLEEKVRSYQLENFVEFLGRVKNVDEYYKKCKFFVLTSRFEGLGIVLLEAKSYKLPIISFDCDCGPNEMITDNVNGYLVPLFNVELMADKIFSLLNDNEKCQDMSKNSFIEMKNFDEKVIIEKWNLLFEKLLGVRK